jgi:hypothetical protein
MARWTGREFGDALPSPMPGHTVKVREPPSFHPVGGLLLRQIVRQRRARPEAILRPRLRKAKREGKENDRTSTVSTSATIAARTTTCAARGTGPPARAHQTMTACAGTSNKHAPSESRKPHVAALSACPEFVITITLPSRHPHRGQRQLTDPAIASKHAPSDGCFNCIMLTRSARQI